MGTEENLIFRIENDLRKLKNKKEVDTSLTKSRLQRLQKLNLEMYLDLQTKLTDLINPAFHISIAEYKNFLNY